jgi:hypothetical protein
MDKDKRKVKRINISCKARLHFLDIDKEISVNIKDITISGIRIIIGGRMAKVNTPVKIRLHINERDIQCKGRVAWVLAMRPGTGNINLFDVGIEFTEMNSEDKVFLERLLLK